MVTIELDKRTRLHLTPAMATVVLHADGVPYKVAEYPLVDHTWAFALCKEDDAQIADIQRVEQWLSEGAPETRAVIDGGECVVAVLLESDGSRTIVATGEDGLCSLGRAL